jgi:hypothetical protein
MCTVKHRFVVSQFTTQGGMLDSFIDEGACS